MTMLRHDLAKRLETDAARYTVTPAQRENDHEGPPVVFSARDKAAAVFGMQDYLTPDQADELAEMLHHVAARARELNPTKEETRIRGGSGWRADRG